MPPKRARSATVQEADGNSSNVTDYMGSPTRRQKGPASARRITRLRRSVGEDEEGQDDDDGSVNVPFNQVSSAVNEARLGQPRTIHGLQPNIQPPTSATRVEDTETAPPSKRKRGRPRKVLQHPTAQQRPREEASNQQQFEENRPLNGIYEIVSSPLKDVMDLGKNGTTQTTRSTRSTNSTPQRTRQQREMSRKAAAPIDDDEQEVDQEGKDSEIEGEEAADDEEAEAEKGDEASLEASSPSADDSAFIDAPRPDENLPEVTCTVRSLGGMIETLRHSAWTGMSKWDDEPDMKCSTKMGGQLIEQARQLNDLLVESAEARDGAEEDYEVTLSFLRQNNTKVNSIFASITELVDTICRQKLVATDNLRPTQVKTRKRFLRDISKRLVPMLVLVLQKALDLGPSQRRKSVIDLTLNTFTIQFLLRATGWADRLTRALLQGLGEWSIDESDESEDDLGRVGGTSKSDKMKWREVFQKQLSSLYSAGKTAMTQLENQARAGQRKAVNDRLRRKAQIQQRNNRAAMQRDEEEEQQRSLQQYERFARSTQALRDFPDPLAVKLRQALAARDAPVASQTSASQADGVSSQRSKGKERAVPQNEDDVDPFVVDDEDNELSPRSVRSDHISKSRPTHNGSRAGHTTRPLQARKEWTKRDASILIKAIQTENYDLFTMATRLGQSAEYVANEANRFRGLFRGKFRSRNEEIPEWALHRSS